jgi:predicted site-specific integrase-resolvase
MKLSAWAKLQGIHYKTAWRWWKCGNLPVHAYRTPTGAVFVNIDSHPRTSDLTVGLYARVSSSDQKSDLDAQLGRLASFAASNGMAVVATATEVGSGLNGHRPKLMGLLGNPAIGAIVIEHRDRLMRFGAEYVQATLAAHGRRLIVIHADEVKDDLVQDMIEVLTSFCARLYGRRSAKNRASKALQSIHG